MSKGIKVEGICTKCNAPVDPLSKFCGKCGKIIEREESSTMTCPNCSHEVEAGKRFCNKCGTKLMEYEDVNITVQNANEGEPFDSSKYDSTYFNNSENYIIDKIIQEEISKDSSYNSKTIPQIEKRKNIITIIYSILFIAMVTIYVAYHTAIFQLLIVTVTIVYLLIIKNYTTKKYLSKQVKLRPDEKISYIVSSSLSGTTSNKQQHFMFRLIILAITVSIPLIIFSKPHIIYEKQSNGGYAIRYYTYGILQKDKELVIPSTYKGENVTSIRGDVFKRVYSLEKVTLPDTITEIRGSAFKNCEDLKSINLPKGITEIHGNTFEGCKSLESIEIPKGVTRIGGNAFANCINLTGVSLPETINEIGGGAFYSCANIKSINLPKGITEIHGSTFEGCTNLQSIIIPEGVTRIGGSAFRDCSNLSNAIIPNSVNEIGSSAFRGTNLESVCISKTTMVNERAFKDMYINIYYYEDNCKQIDYDYDSDSYYPGDRYNYGY